MKKHSRTAALVGLLVCTSVLALAQTGPQREKVAEGQYSEWKDGQPLQDTMQSWTMWRVADGFEVEDHLPPNKAAMMMAVMDQSLGSRMSPELRRDIQNAATTTDIHLQLTKNWSLVGLTLRGVRSSDPKSKSIEVARCEFKDGQIVCKGQAGKAHLKTSEQQQLSYSHPFPLLYTPILLGKDSKQNEPSPFKLAILEGVDQKMVLAEVSGQLTHLGQEPLVLGQYTFRAEKYLLAMGTKTGPRKVTLWASREGIVFAMEDSLFVPGLRVVLTQYKQYSDF